MERINLDTAGVVYALASGGLASGLGYALWYAALPALAATTAASLQLSVPVLAALGAKAAGRPVKVALTMEEQFYTITKHPSTFRIKTGVAPVRGSTMSANWPSTSWSRSR